MLPDKNASDLKKLFSLYRDVESSVHSIEEKNLSRLKCGQGCSSCCVDDLTVFEVEALNIQTQFGELLENESPNKPGSCAFLDDKGLCRIYEARPYVCRTQGLPLRWEDEDEKGDPVEFRDICPVNAEGTPLVDLPDSHFLTLGHFEGKLAEIQAIRDSWALNRVALRSLFNQD